MAVSTTYECDDASCTETTSNPSLWIMVSAAITDAPLSSDPNVEQVYGTTFCSLTCANNHISSVLS